LSSSHVVHPLGQARAAPPRLGQLVRPPFPTSARSLTARRIPPVLTVDSGAVVDFDCLDASNGQITPASTAVDLAALAVDTLDQVNGPIFVRGATPGSVLRVDVLAAAPAAWGWTGIIPGFGLLADEFTTPALKIWELDAEAGYAWFDKEKGIRIPLRPFCGEMGLARAAPGKHSTIPPYRTGGNIDTRHVTVGSSLFLPIEVEGALFSIGVRAISDFSGPWY
jgi:acetamidase/formamidase